MDKKFLITLIATQKINDDTDSVTFTAPAEFYIKDGTKYIVYKEYGDSSMTSEDFVLNTIKVYSPEKVSVTRKQKYTSRLFLEKFNTHQTQYRTPVGSIIFGVMCTDIEDSLTPDGGTLNVEYNLLQGASLISENSFNITVKEA